jgi:hypothetical protein
MIPQPQQGDYIFFEVLGGGSQGAWCATRADWYVSEYVAKAGGGTTSQSGNWNKWYRAGDQNQAWQGPTQTAYTNYWGTSCGSMAWDWCSEWGLGNRYNAVMPGQGANGNGECYAQQWSGGANWKVSIRLAGSRIAACGF